MGGRSSRIVIVIAALAIAADVVADSATADKLAADAQSRAGAGDFLGAAAKYREAFAASPRPELLCNVGVAYYKAKDLPRAQRHLAHCLAIGTSLDPAFISNVKKVLTAVEQKLATEKYTPVDIFVQPQIASVTVTGGVPYDDPIVGSGRVWFPAGHYALVVHAEGFTDQTIEIDAKDQTPVRASVALQRAPIVEVGSGSATQVDTGVGSAPPAGSDSPDPRRIIVEPAPKSKLLPIAATVGTFAAGGVALTFWSLARGAADKAGDAETMPAWQGHADDARRYQHVSWGLAAVTGAGAIVTGYLWYRALRTETTVEVNASGSGAGVTLSGRW